MSRLPNRMTKAELPPIVPKHLRISRLGFGMRKRETAKVRLVERDGEGCAFCGRVDGPMWIDHTIPVCRGGTHDDENLVISCPACNLSKFWNADASEVPPCRPA